MTKKPNLNQINELLNLIEGRPELKDYFDFQDPNSMAKMWEFLESITYKQYRFYLALIYNRKSYQLISILREKGIKTREIIH